MSRNLLYPRSISVDFGRELVNEIKELCTKDLTEIYPILRKWVDGSLKIRIVCLLRYLIDQPQTPKTAVLIGYLALNSLIPPPTLLNYMFLLLKNLNTDYGEKCCVAFAQSLMLNINKYPWFSISLITNPGFEYRYPDLFSSLYQLIDTPANVNPFLYKLHYAIPDQNSNIDCTQRLPRKSVTLEKNPNEPKRKTNMHDIIQVAYSLMPNHVHFVSSCLMAIQAPESLMDAIPPIILDSMILYLKFYIEKYYNSSESLSKWDRYPDHKHLIRIGNWIGVLSIAKGMPPRLHKLDMARILKDGISYGFLAEAVCILIGFYQRASKKYFLPNVYTKNLLEIMAAAYYTPGVRADICALIDKFASILRTKISYFRGRFVNFPETSGDLHAQFIQDSHSNLFSLTKYTPNAVVGKQEERAEMFFGAHPFGEKLMNIREIREIVNRALSIEKYYFVAHGEPILNQKYESPTQEIFDSIVCLAFSRCSVISSTAAEILRKMDQQNFSALSLRYSFPTRDLFKAVMKNPGIDPKELNSVFSDILTNPMINKMALPLVKKIVPLIFQFDRRRGCTTEFDSLFNLTEMYPKKEELTIPLPDVQHLQMLRVFVEYCRTGDSNTLQDFIAIFNPGSIQQVANLCLLIISSVGENDDYSAIDSFASIIPKLSQKIKQGTLIPGMVRAFDMMTRSSVVEHRKAIFRLAHQIISSNDCLTPSRLFPFFERYSPGSVPGFSACWMQLVLHPKVFVPLADSGDAGLITFCIKFTSTVLRLAARCPEVFYKPVARMLMLISSEVPDFIVSYHLLFIEVIPTDFVQFRNIICSAIPSNANESFPPPCGIAQRDSPEMKAVKAKVDTFVVEKAGQQNAQPHNVKFILDTIHRISPHDPSFMWRTVLYLVSNIQVTAEGISSINAISELAVGLAEPDGEFINCILDHLRYPNTHTSIATSLLTIIFNRASDPVREALFVTVIRRLMCVTPPPPSVRVFFNGLVKERGTEILNMFKRNGESEEYAEVVYVIKLLC